MYNVKIRDHIMIAHSLPDPFFGPAQHMHGATYVVDVSFFSKELDKHNVVIDIGKAHEVTKEILAPLSYQNLDEHPDMQGDITTTEYLAKYIHGQLAKKLSGVFSGLVRVTLGESHVAWAGYEGEI